MRRLLAVVAAAAAALSLTAAPASAASEPHVVAGGLVHPWGMALLPDGSTLFTERHTRRIWELRPGRPARVIYTVREAAARGEGGLLGIAVTRNYPRDNRVFLYYTTGSDNRVAFVRRGSAMRPQPILTGIPAATTHNGGRIAFGPDGQLYVATGDAAVRQRAQDRSSLGGKILRITGSGAAAPGNPGGSRVWSLGHRNVQGMSWDRAGRMWASELGQNAYDEVNLIVPGGNYGWPVVEGRGGDARFRDPVHVWRPAEASPSGVAIKGDSLYVAALRGQRLWRLQLSGERVVRATALYTGRFGRLRDVGQHPRDGAVWLATTNGRGDRLIRVSRFP